MSRRDLIPRERIVTESVAEGLPNAEISARLGISNSTVKQNVANILIKSNGTNRTRVAVEATHRGVVRPNPLAHRTRDPSFIAVHPLSGR